MSPHRRVRIERALLPVLFAASAASAQTSSAPNAADARRAELLRERAAIDAELAALDAARNAPPPASASPQASADQRVQPDEIVVTGKALSLTTQVIGQTVTTVDEAAYRNTPATTIADIVKLSPGVSVIQGNGPRDVGVSIRGSNARNSFGARNIQVFEDDFPVTQPDGLARFDLTDPHAYGAVDVVRGPSSARYGNYAIGGAVNFRTRRGRDMGGAEFGLDGGSNGYANLYGTIGNETENAALQKATRKLANWGLGAEFPIISVGGLMSADDVVARLLAGANLVQLYTGFVYRGPALLADILQRLNPPPRR